MNWRALQKFYQNRRLVFLLIISHLALCYYMHTILMLHYQFSNKEDIKKIKKYPDNLTKYLNMMPKVNRTHMSKAEILQNAQQTATNFPILFWEANKNQNLYYKNKSCSRFPNVYELKVNNLYWQLLQTTKATYYLFGAYYDIRQRCSICPAIRLLANIDHKEMKEQTFCQIWFADSDEPLIVESSQYFYILTRFKTSTFPGLLTCPIPHAFNGRIPIFVSLVENMCDHASNSLRVIFNKLDNADKKTKKAGFAVCGKLFDYLHDDQSLRLIEWIELVRLLGADKIIVSTLFVHENMLKVLKYYEEQGVLEWTPTTLVGNVVKNLPYFQHLYLYQPYWLNKFPTEIVQINDCFYKNMYKYDYITMLDVDEVIIPHIAYSWTDLMESMLKNLSSSHNISAFHSSMVMFPDCENQTEAMCYMLQHIICDRSDLILNSPKTIYDTERVESVDNHYPKRCLEGMCEVYWIKRKNAELFHYRNGPFKDRWLSCEKLVRRNHVDTTIWKYKEQLIDRTMTTLYNLGNL